MPYNILNLLLVCKSVPEALGQIRFKKNNTEIKLKNEKGDYQYNRAHW